jgi:hypothetical protein
MGPETTVRVMELDESSLVETILNDMDDSVEEVFHLSQQFRTGGTQMDSLTLGPGQRAAMPLPFLPRFPLRRNSVAQALPSEGLNPWQRADRTDWLRPYPLRNNLHAGAAPPLNEYYRVSGTLLVETDQGVQSVPLEATSIHLNSFGLPATISLGGSVDGDTEASTSQGVSGLVSEAPGYQSDEGIRIMDRLWNTVDGAAPVVSSNCYDLYVRHPRGDGNVEVDEAWQIGEVLVSNPDRVSLHLLPEHLGADNAAASFSGSGKHVIRSWLHTEPTSPRIIPPDDQPHYLVTVCPSPSDDRDASAEEYVKSMEGWITPADQSLGWLMIQSDAPALFIELEPVRLKEVSIPKNQSTGEIALSSLDGIGTPISTLLKPSNGVIDLFVLSSMAGSTRSTTVSLDNASTRDMHIMFASLAFSRSAEVTLEKYGISLTLRPTAAEGNWSIDGLGSSDLFDLCISVDKMAGHNFPREVETVTGRLLVQGSFSDSVPRQWMADILRDPGLDIDTFVEIPVSLSLVSGEIGVQMSGTTRFERDFWVTREGHGGISLVEAGFFPESLRALPYYTTDQMDHAIITNEGMTYQLNIVSTVPAPLRVQALKIVDEDSRPVASSDASRCERFQVLKSRESTDGDSQEALGTILVRYTFPDDTNVVSHEYSSMSSCKLVIETEPDTGFHSIPLVVYTGELTVSHPSESAGRLDPTKSLKSSSSRVQALVGYEEILDWMDRSESGKSFQSILMPRRNRGSKSFFGQFEQQMRSLASESINESGSGIRIRPVLLSIGTVDPGESHVFSLHIANNNPVPVTLSLKEAEFEGFSIRLGRDRVVGSSNGRAIADVLLRSLDLTKETLDKIPSKPSPGRGQRLESLFHFLKTSAVPAELLSRFIYRDAISIDNDAALRFPRPSQSLHGTTFATFYSDDSGSQAVPSNSTPCQNTEHTGVGEFVHSSIAKISHLVPSLFLTNSLRVAELRRCPPGVLSVVVIPPAGVARFDVTVSSPSANVLDNDINSVLATGMTISTNSGEVMPLLLSFEVPKGSLVLSPFSAKKEESSQGSQHVLKVEIASALFQGNHNSSSCMVNHTSSHPNILVPSKEKGSPSFDALRGLEIVSPATHRENEGYVLFAKSSFSRDLLLHRVESCNPWFQVFLDGDEKHHEPDPFLGVKVGTITHGVPCGDPNTLPEFNSFHGCAIEWIKQWMSLQNNGCGRQGVESQSTSLSDARQQVDMARLHNSMLQLSAWSFACHNEFFESSVVTAAERFFDGYLPKSLVSVAASIASLWRQAKSQDVFTMSSDLRGIVTYNSSEQVMEDEMNQFFSLPIHNFTLVSQLRPVSLLDHERLSVTPPDDPFGPSTVEMPKTLVGTPVAMKIPLHNPSAVPVRVRLASFLKDNTRDDVGPDFDVGAGIRRDFLTSHPPPYVQGPIYADLGPDQVNQMWWDGAGSFYFPDVNGGLIRSHHNVSVRAGSHAYVGLISPSLLSSSAFLYGCGTRCGVHDEPAKNEAAREIQRKAIIGASAASGNILIGRRPGDSKEEKRLRDAKEDHFFPAGISIHSSRQSPAAFGIPFAALEEIVIEPYGTAEIGPVYFRPPGRSSHLSKEGGIGGSGHADDPFYALIFLENSLTGLERVILKGEALWESFEFQNFDPGDDESMSDIESRNGFPALMFPGTLVPPFPSSDSVRKEVKLKNNGDTVVSFEKAYLSERGRSREPVGFAEPCDLSDFSLLNCSSEESFPILTLAPGESASLYVTHRPRCIRRTEFIALNLEYVDDSAPHTKEGFRNDQSSRARRAHERKQSFRRSKETLLIGYDMEVDVYSVCVPSNTHLFRPLVDPPRLLTPTGQSVAMQQLAENVKAIRTFKVSPSYLIWVALFVLVWLGLLSVDALISVFRKRLVALDKFRKFESGKLSGEKYEFLLMGMAREVPSATDIEKLGKDCVRAKVFSRLRTVGALPPQCVSPTGVLQRDRSHLLPVRGPQSASKDRTRTMSEALFHRFTDCHLDNGLLPANTGWRTAVSRGIINETSFKGIQDSLRTHHLLVQRSRNRTLKKPRMDMSGNDADNVVGYQGAGEAAITDPNDATPHEAPSDIESDSTDAELRSEVSDFDLSVSESSLVGGSGKNGYLSNGNLNDHADSGFKTIRADKGSRHRPRKSDTKQSADSSRKHTSAVPERNPHPAPPKPVTGKPAAPNKPPRTAPLRKQKPSSERPRGWAQVAASSHSPPHSSSPDRRLLGLAPPPGFGAATPMSPENFPTLPSKQAEGFSLDFSAGNTYRSPEQPSPLSRGVSESSSHSGDNSLLLGSPLLSRSYLSRDDSSDQLPVLNMFLGESREAENTSSSRTETNVDFDVLEFLDGILNDGANHGDETAASAVTFPSTAILNASSDPVVPANPWADAGDSATASRASLYGISFNDAPAEETMTFPLLTPQAILENDDRERDGSQASKPLYARFEKS